MNDSLAGLADLNSALVKIQQSSRRTLPVFVLGILATVIAAAIAIYYILTLSADLSEARAALQSSQAALLEARSNLAAANGSLRQAQAATSSPADARKIETAISNVSRSEASISNASSSISSAEARLAPAEAGPRKESSPVRRRPPTAVLEKPVAYDIRFEVVDTGDGFLSLRSKPSMASTELARIPDGDLLQCGQASRNVSGNLWRACRDSQGHTGFVSNKFIRQR